MLITSLFVDSDMSKITKEQIEEYVTVTYGTGSRKVYRSHLNKFAQVYNVIDDESIEQIFSRVKIGMKDTVFSVLRSTVEKFLKSEFFLGQLTGQTTEEPVYNTATIEAGLREANEYLKIRKAEIEKLEAEKKAQQEALEEAKKQEALAEAKRLAEAKARQQEGVIPKGKFLEVIRKTAKLCTEINPMIHSSCLDIEQHIIKKNPNYTYLEGERALICGALLSGTNIFMYGDAGLGKSTAVRQFCYEEGIPCVRQGANSEAQTDDLFYQKTFENNEVKYILQGWGLAQHITNVYGACVFIRDEQNADNESTMIGVHSVTDDIREMHTELGIMSINEGCKLLYWATGNIGYAGVNSLTPAFRSRFLSVKKQRPADEFTLANIWTENAPLEVKEKLLQVVHKIKEAQKSRISANVSFDIREPKNILKNWDLIPRKILLDSIAGNWAENVDDQEYVQKIVSEVFSSEY